MKTPARAERARVRRAFGLCAAYKAWGETTVEDAVIVKLLAGDGKRDRFQFAWFAASLVGIVSFLTYLAAVIVGGSWFNWLCRAVSGRAGMIFFILCTLGAIQLSDSLLKKPKNATTLQIVK